MENNEGYTRFDERQDITRSLAGVSFREGREKKLFREFNKRYNFKITGGESNEFRGFGEQEYRRMNECVGFTKLGVGALGAVVGATLANYFSNSFEFGEAIRYASLGVGGIAGMKTGAYAGAKAGFDLGLRKLGLR